MSDLRKAAEMALEYLDCAITHNEKKVKAALKEALAQPEQEPVAWICEKNGKRWLAWNSTEHVPSFSTMEPLYTHPAPVPVGWRLVPNEPLYKLLDYAEELVELSKETLAAAPKPEELK